MHANPINDAGSASDMPARQQPSSGHSQWPGPHGGVPGNLENIQERKPGDVAQEGNRAK